MSSTTCSSTGAGQQPSQSHTWASHLSASLASHMRSPFLSSSCSPAAFGSAAGSPWLSWFLRLVYATMPAATPSRLWLSSGLSNGKNGRPSINTYVHYLIHCSEQGYFRCYKHFRHHRPEELSSQREEPPRRCCPGDDWCWCRHRRCHCLDGCLHPLRIRFTNDTCNNNLQDMIRTRSSFLNESDTPLGWFDEHMSDPCLYARISW